MHEVTGGFAPRSSPPQHSCVLLVVDWLQARGVSTAQSGGTSDSPRSSALHTHACAVPGKEEKEQRWRTREVAGAVRSARHRTSAWRHSGEAGTTLWFRCFLFKVRLLACKATGSDRRRSQTHNDDVATTGSTSSTQWAAHSSRGRQQRCSHLSEQHLDVEASSATTTRHGGTCTAPTTSSHTLTPLSSRAGERQARWQAEVRQSSSHRRHRLQTRQQTCGSDASRCPRRDLIHLICFFSLLRLPNSTRTDTRSADSESAPRASDEATAAAKCIDEQ